MGKQVVINSYKTYEPTGSYTYYDLWPQGADLAGKEAVEDVAPSYIEQNFELRNGHSVVITDNKALEGWLKQHDASQIEDVMGGMSEKFETYPGQDVGGSREGRPSDGIVKINLSPEESFNLDKAYKDLGKKNAKYNGVDNNCTTFVCDGLQSVGVNIKPETICDIYNVLIGNVVTEAQTPNNTYNQVKTDPKATVVKDASSATTESYEDAVIDE